MFQSEKEMNTVFRSMCTLAREQLLKIDGNQAHQQCVVLAAEQGAPQAFIVAADTVGEFAAQQCALLSNEMPPVQKIVCMWKSGVVDVPSGAFLKRLCELSAQNKDAEILLKGSGDTYNGKTVADIIG